MKTAAMESGLKLKPKVVKILQAMSSTNMHIGWWYIYSKMIGEFVSRCIVLLALCPLFFFSFLSTSIDRQTKFLVCMCILLLAGLVTFFMCLKIREAGRDYTQIMMHRKWLEKKGYVRSIYFSECISRVPSVLNMHGKTLNEDSFLVGAGPVASANRQKMRKRLVTKISDHWIYSFKDDF